MAKKNKIAYTPHCSLWFYIRVFRLLNRLPSPRLKSPICPIYTYILNQDMSLNCPIGSKGDWKRHVYLFFGHPQCCSLCLIKETHKTEGLHHGWRQQGHAAVNISFKFSDDHRKVQPLSVYLFIKFFYFFFNVLRPFVHANAGRTFSQNEPWLILVSFIIGAATGCGQKE